MTLAMLAQVACTQPTAGEEDVIGETHQAVLTKNSLTKNSLTKNSLTKNSLTKNSLTKNSLTKNSLTKNSLTKNALTDPAARELLTYVVSCALPEDAGFSLEIEGETYQFDGQLGLAPEWGEDGGHCDDECVSWVSACVISRLDYTGVSKDISVRGKHEALYASPEEQEDFPSREATYYGDIFASPQQIFACLPPGQTEIPRVCGPSIEGCVVVVQGNCEDLCGHVRADGSYPACHEQGTPKELGGYHKGSKHVGSVTVFLPEP